MKGWNLLRFLNCKFTNVFVNKEKNNYFLALSLKNASAIVFMVVSIGV